MMIKLILSILLFLILIYGLVYFFQRHFIYFPASEVPSLKYFQAEDMHVVKLSVADGFTLNSWYKPPSDNKPVILYMHGNAGHIGYRMYLVRYFLAAGFGVLLLEYRGYGGNPGEPNEAGFYQDGRAAIKYLQQHGIQTSNIVFYGESLGSGVATQLATEFSVCALVLQSPYTSLTELARHYYFGLPIPIRDKFDSLSKIQKIHVPLLILHGQLDNVVPYSQGLTLYNKANQPKEWIGFPHKGHQDMWDDTFANKVINFINSYCTHSQ